MFKTLLMTTALVAFAGAAQAQTSTAPAPMPPNASPPAATMPAERYGGHIVNKSQGVDDWRTSKLVGLGVYNNANEKVGNIDDLIINSQGQVSLAVIGVGGFLSIGTKDVAIDFKSLHMARDVNNKPIAKLDATKDQLKDAPEYVFLKDSVTVAPDAPRRPAR